MNESKRKRRRPSAKAKQEEKFITGKVTSIEVKGFGQNSAQLVFVIHDEKTGDEQAIMVTAYPAYEPQVFTAMTALLTGAHFAKKRVTVGYFQKPTETNYAVEVKRHS